jgi:hypothetical protein
VLYSAAAERLLETRVDRMEYHFPTRKGENQRKYFGRSELSQGLGLVESLLQVAASGRFLPTDKESDCAFCDFRHVCRVESVKGGEARSPLAVWGSRRLEADDAYDLIRAVRYFEGAP